MKLGFFTRPLHPLDKNWQTCLNEDREAIILADKLGYTEAYVGEHLSDKAENITSCIAFIASLAYETKNIRLGTGTVNIPNLHPVHIAGQVAMIDNMLNGRFNFGISPGGLISDAELFGNLKKDRSAMFLEGINTILKIWSTEAPYKIKGDYWDVTTENTLIEDIGQGYMTRPLQRPHPPIIVTAVAPYSKGISEAAARGWKPISADIIMPNWVKTHWEKYVEGCKKGKLIPSKDDWRIAKTVFVAEDLKKAKEYALGPNSPYVFYFKQLFKKFVALGKLELFKSYMNQPDSEITLEKVCEELIIWGTPEKVFDDISSFRDNVGDFGMLMYAGVDWLDPSLAKKSMSLMAEKVNPHL